jgi:hypothetical protein
MRRTHLRGHDNIVKRVLLHASGFNLGLVMRRLIGVGTPRGLQGRVAALIAVLLSLWRTLAAVSAPLTPSNRDRPFAPIAAPLTLRRRREIGPCTTGC